MDSKERQLEALFICYDSVARAIAPTVYHGLPLKTSKEFLELHYPLFVTWLDRGTEPTSVRLRGCIGTFSDKDNLKTTLAKYALLAARHDIRRGLKPIDTFNELTQRVTCEVSLLHSFKDIAFDDWELKREEGHNSPRPFSFLTQKKCYL